MAEEVGFEPTVALRPQRFSRPSDSSTLALLQLDFRVSEPLCVSFSVPDLLGRAVATRNDNRTGSLRDRDLTGCDNRDNGGKGREGDGMDNVPNEVNEEAASAEFQLLVTPEGRADPYPHYHTLRTVSPVHRSIVAQGWLLTRYDDCHSVLRDPRMVRGFAPSMDIRFPDWREHPAIAGSERSMLNLDGPDHMRLRQLVVKAFTPRTVERLRPRMEAFVDELLEPLAEKRGGDLMEELAFPLPVRVIGELLGIPEEDQPPFRQRVQQLTAIFEVTATPDMLDGADVAQLEADAYFADLLEAKRARPGSDLLSQLVGVEDADNKLSVDELSTLALLLFAAGFETTTNLVGNAMLGLLAHPEQMDVLRAQPDLFTNLPDELLRYDGTVQIAARLATEPVEVGGVVIDAGDPVFPLVGAANHDPARYRDPDRLDVTRTDVRPLTFGGGLHFCLGAALAKAETEIVFRKLLERFPTIELAGEARYRDRLTLRGPSEVPIAVTERSRMPTRRTAASGTARSTRLFDNATSTVAELRPAPPAVPRRGGARRDVLPSRPLADDGAWRAEYRARLEAGSERHIGDLAAVAALLGRVPLFTGCTVNELEDLAATAYPIAFEAGEELCAEGAESLECYVIAEGEASVVIGGVAVVTVVSDDVVGERGPLLDAPRTATVTARTHMLTYAISRERLQRLVHDSPSAKAGIEDALRRRFGTTDH